MPNRPSVSFLLVPLLLVLTGTAQAAAPRKLSLTPFDGKSATLDLSGRPAQLAADAKLTFAGKKLVLDEGKQLAVRRFLSLVEGNRAYVVLEYKQTYPKETERLERSIYNVPGKTDLGLSSAIHVAAIDLDKTEVAWRVDLSNMQCEGGWELVDTTDAFYVRTLTTVYALGKRSGRFRWILDSDPLEGVLNDRYLLSWKVVGESFVFETVNRVDYEPQKPARKTLELDIVSGDRVFRSTPVPKLEPQPVYVYQRHTIEYPGDRPAPKLPDAFDGVKLERTLLLWSKTTREGIIVNPQRALLPQIVELAQRQLVDGKKVEWRYVVDLVAANHAFGTRQRDQVLAGYRDAYMGSDEIFLEPTGELEHSGERIAAAEVAKAIGATALVSPPPEKTALTAAPLFVFRTRTIGHAGLAERDWPFNLELKWGPYVVHEQTYDRPYWKLE